MCGILCNRDNCNRGPLSQVGPGPPTCLIRPWFSHFWNTLVLYGIRDIDKLKKIQRAAARFVANNYLWCEPDTNN